MMNLKAFGRTGHGLMQALHWNLHEVAEINHEKSQASSCPCRDSNGVPPEDKIFFKVNNISD
jgi:hypothetical protein